LGDAAARAAAGAAAQSVASAHSLLPQQIAARLVALVK